MAGATWNFTGLKKIFMPGMNLRMRNWPEMIWPRRFIRWNTSVILPEIQPNVLDPYRD